MGCWEMQGAGEALLGGGESRAGVQPNCSSRERPLGNMAVACNPAGGKSFCVGVHSPCSIIGFGLPRPCCLRTRFVCTIQPASQTWLSPSAGAHTAKAASGAECCCEKFSCYRFSTSKHVKKLRSAYPSFLSCYFSLGHRC